MSSAPSPDMGVTNATRLPENMLSRVVDRRGKIAAEGPGCYASSVS
jgi:hypothetical protein